jgi:cyclic beta-1,2-glucan synthetase
MAHPLNQPRYDPETGPRRRGLRHPPAAHPHQPHRGEPLALRPAQLRRSGIDPYTREVSDVYQDLFAEGTYVGKGSTMWTPFAATAGRFPENLILSHDLVESNYARSALVSDVELHEDHPFSFAAEMSRRHRWIRGDWQIAGWLLPRVLGPGTGVVPNTLTALGWWKIFDNLRRSLVPPALLLLLLAGWLLVPEPAGFWTGSRPHCCCSRSLISPVESGEKTPRNGDGRFHLGTAMKGLAGQLAEAGLSLASAALPHRHPSRCHLRFGRADGLHPARTAPLAHPALREAQPVRRPLVTSCERCGSRRFSPSSLCGHCDDPSRELLASGPVLLLWLVFPAIGWWISRPIQVEKAP